jgi:multiple sugar transport system substrate-binding protein
MPSEIELSIIQTNPAIIAPILEKFEAENHVRVRVTTSSWDTSWSQLVKVALYGDGPDVSEIGSSWVSDLVSMQAILPFSNRELAILGKPEEFFPASWAGGIPADQKQLYAFPWMTGVRVIYYRSNLLEKAGVDADKAFSSFQELENAIQILSRKKIQYPWIVPTDPTHTTLLNVVSWVWANGGQFMSSNGKSVMFDHPEALEAFQQYFRLGLYIPQTLHTLTGIAADDWFIEKNTSAMTISGPWMLQQIRNRLSPQEAAKIKIALLPGPNFSGGSYLVAWKHSHKREFALRLIRYLTESEPQQVYSQQIGLMPVRIEALKQPPYTTDPLLQKMVEAQPLGRHFQVTRMWGLVEDRLTTTFAVLWKLIFEHPQKDPDQIVTETIQNLARRLNLTLDTHSPA